MNSESESEASFELVFRNLFFNEPFFADYGPDFTCWATCLSLLGEGFELVSEMGWLLIPGGMKGLASIDMLFCWSLLELAASD